MASRHQNRIFSDPDRDALLAAIGLCRNACVHACTAAPVNEPIYRAVNVVMAAIDILASELKGGRTHFHLKDGAPSNEIPQ